MTKKKNINDDGGEHCLTCLFFPHVQFIAHEFYCLKIDELTKACRCAQYAINFNKYLTIELCPECNEPFEMTAKSPLRHSTCKQGHSWHICPVHHVVIGAPLHNNFDGSCTCELKGSESITTTVSLESTYIDIGVPLYAGPSKSSLQHSTCKQGYSINAGVPLHMGLSVYQQRVRTMTNELLKACSGKRNPLAEMGYYGRESMLQNNIIKDIVDQLAIIKLATEKIEDKLSEFHERTIGG